MFKHSVALRGEFFSQQELGELSGYNYLITRKPHLYHSTHYYKRHLMSAFLSSFPGKHDFRCLAPRQ